MSPGEATLRTSERLFLVAAAVLAALVLVPVAFVVPFGGFVLAAPLLVGGALARRRAATPFTHAAGGAAVALGFLLLAVGVVELLAYSTGRGTDVDSGTS